MHHHQRWHLNGNEAVADGDSSVRGRVNVPGFEVAFSADSSCTLAWPTAMGHLLKVSPQTVGSTVGIGLNETCTLCMYLPDSSYPVAVYSEAIDNMKNAGV